MPRMAAQPAMAQGESLVADQHALRGDVIRLAAAGTVMIPTEGFRFIEQGAEVRHAGRHCIHGANWERAKVSRISTGGAMRCGA